MVFASREDAGGQLARRLEREHAPVDLVLGLPRGGVVVAAEVAARLDRPLDVLLVRKIGHPFHREFAVGALAEPDIVLLHEQAIRQTGARPDDLEAIIDEERARLRDYRERFVGEQPPDLRHQRVLLVDDGLATGSTMQAAIQAAKKRGANEVLAAVPVASESAYRLVSREAAKVYALLVDPDFDAVGRYYQTFEQTTDAEVVERLRKCRRPAHPA